MIESAAYFVLGYFLFSLCGALAMIELKRMPIWKRDESSGEIKVIPGSSVSRCEAFSVMGVSLVPFVNVIFNIIWAFILWDYWRKGRPFSKSRVLFEGRTGR